VSDPEKTGWTLNTLKSLMDERDRRYGEVSEAKERAISAAMAAAEKAILVAENNAEKWRMNANEWRSAMNDRERQFLSKGMGYVVGALSAIALVLTIADKLFK